MKPLALYRQLTQTSLYPAGNCWQTAVACLLDVDPESMPPQAEYDWVRVKPDGSKEYGPSYHNVLQDYLRKHHGLTYVELQEPSTLFALLRIAEPGWHLLTWRTVRSDAYGGVRHVVVGRYGEVAWDPHPSRAGLLEEIRWAFLVPYPEEWARDEAARVARGYVPTSCVCPACKAAA